jgi:hypothetical protein
VLPKDSSSASLFGLGGCCFLRNTLVLVLVLVLVLMLMLKGLAVSCTLQTVVGGLAFVLHRVASLIYPLALFCTKTSMVRFVQTLLR